MRAVVCLLASVAAGALGACVGLRCFQASLPTEDLLYALQWGTVTGLFGFWIPLIAWSKSGNGWLAVSSSVSGLAFLAGAILYLWAELWAAV
jgi:hypothetical protein